MADQGFMQMLKQRLMAAGGGQQPQPQPEFQGNPWDNPAAVQPPPQQMAPPPQMPMQSQMPMQMAPTPDMAGVGSMGGTQSPMDEALMLALKRKRFNQAFAGGTGNPTPQ